MNFGQATSRDRKLIIKDYAVTESCKVGVYKRLVKCPASVGLIQSFPFQVFQDDVL